MRKGTPVCIEAYAHCESREEEEEQHDVAATAYIDQQVLTALDLVDLDLKKEYRQVVLLGCGFDTRPYRCVTSDKSSHTNSPYSGRHHYCCGSR